MKGWLCFVCFFFFFQCWFKCVTTGNHIHLQTSPQQVTWKWHCLIHLVRFYLPKMQQSAFMFIFVMSELKKFHSYMLVINNLGIILQLIFLCNLCWFDGWDKQNFLSRMLLEILCIHIFWDTSVTNQFFLSLMVACLAPIQGRGFLQFGQLVGWSVALFHIPFKWLTMRLTLMAQEIVPSHSRN